MNKKGFIYLAVVLAVLIGVGAYFLVNIQKGNSVLGSSEVTSRPAEFPEAAPVTPEDEEECYVSPQSLNAVVDINSPEVESVVRNELLQNEKRFVQHVILKDGTHIEYSEGGCAHFSYQLSISPYTPVQEMKSVWITDALQQLNRPIFTEDGKDEMNVFLKALEEAKDDTKPAEENGMELACGDAHCKLRVVDMKLTLSYDMAM